MAKNIIIGQSGGPTAVINSSLAGVYKAARSLGADKVYGMKYGIEGLLKEELLELNVLLDDRMSIELLKRTPSSYLGSCRFKLPDPDTDATPFVKLFTLFDKYDICAVFYIGGNDSMDTIAKLSRYGQQVGSNVRFIGVPKTIDNDLCLTDHTPGYGSAAKYIATILKEVIRDSSVYNIRSVTVAEIMGRHAGWLAGAACLAGGEDCEGPDLILLPEVPFDQDKFLARVDELQRVKSNVIIAARGRKDCRRHLPVRSGIHRRAAGCLWPQGHPQRHQPLPFGAHPRQAAVQEPCHRVLHPAALRQPFGQPHGCERGLRRWRCRRRCCLCRRERPHDRSQAGLQLPVSVHHRVCGCAAGGKSGKEGPAGMDHSGRDAGDRSL